VAPDGYHHFASRCLWGVNTTLVGSLHLRLADGKVLQSTPTYAKLLHAVLNRHNGLLRNESTGDLAYANSTRELGIEIKKPLWKTALPGLTNDANL
jgi:hypothetical protein